MVRNRFGAPNLVGPNGLGGGGLAHQRTQDARCTRDRPTASASGTYVADDLEGQEPNNKSWIMTVIHHVSAERPCATAQLLTVTYSKGPEHGQTRCVTVTDSRCACSARPVGMRAVPDTDDDHSVLVLVDTENDPVVASAGCAIAVHLAS
jgi:hypothetical protein